jgi:hypothetical protein
MEEEQGQDLYARRGRRGCPPHGPFLVDSVDGGSSCVARCLACGLAGPEGRDSAEAMRAFGGRRASARRPDAIHSTSWEVDVLGGSRLGPTFYAR